MGFLRTILLVGFLSGGFLQAKTLQEWLSVPPAFEAMYGNPEVVVKPELGGLFATPKLPASRFNDARRFFQLPKGKKLVFTTPINATPEQQREELARLVATEFYRRVLSPGALAGRDRRLQMAELIEMNRESFLRLAIAKLQGGRAPSAIGETWWKVRMGLPLTPDPVNQMVVINLHYDHKGKKTTLGHFCFAIRKRGGDPNRDTVFDFRAPWFEDRSPRFTEAANIHNRLKISAATFNFYDWLYTQTEYRHCYVNLWFVPVAKEQVALLRYFETNEKRREAGNFRVCRKNCASLGSEFLDRLQPLTRPHPGIGLFADFPVLAGERFVERFETVDFYRLTNVTDQRGREPTAKSKIHSAQPSRSSSRAYRLLRKAEAGF